MIRSIYFSLCFGLAFLGLVIAIYLDEAIGLSMFALFIIKPFLCYQIERRLNEK
tara:strand:+ start:139 stop:300 length:162 start_codon:yes stop_codon:yes gene_type:complete